VIRRSHRIALLGALLAGLALPSSAQADFGFEPGSLKARIDVAEGLSGVPQASSHPYDYSVSFEVNGFAEGFAEGGEIRNVLIDLPPGFAGDPFAVDRCARQEFDGFKPHCPTNSQVGILQANLGAINVSGPIYNMVPPPGVAAQLGFSAAGLNALQNVSVHTGEGTGSEEGTERYGLDVDTLGLPLEALSVNATVWGTPAESSHDDLRGPDNAAGTLAEPTPVPYVGAHNAFLTLPADCSKPIRTTVKINSVLDPKHYVSETAESLDPGGHPAAPQGCADVPFHPGIAAAPTSRSTSSPAGLDFALNLPNEGLHNPFGIAETEPQKVEVVLPAGLTANPSFAEGLGTCSESQYRAEGVDTPAGAGCPEASKLGSVVANSPLLDEAIEGSLYLATPYANRFGSLVAVYMVLRAPVRGVLIKQAGEVKPDLVTGQLTSTFEDLPPLPFSDFTLHFREGARAPLVTPQACGEYVTNAKLYPFSAPGTATERSASFQIERGADGGACPSGGTPPFHPGLIAGSINNAAGAYSPFNVRIFRSDAEQEITHFSIKLPPGVTGKLAGIPFCSDAAIAAAKTRERQPHGGQEELDNPSCPAASEVGHTLVGAGVGNSLTYVPGKVYMAGPYHGDSLSIVAITAAKAGPFDLGTVVVREGLEVNPETAEVFVDATGSDPIPHIIAGIPVHLRDVRVYVDRPSFTLNPTNCEPTSTASTVLGSGTDFASEGDDRPVTVTTRYQAADCASLGYKPQVQLKLKGSTKRGGNPALTTILRPRAGDANSGKISVALPHSEFLDQSHIGTVCTRVQFKEGGGNGEKCPARSIYGHAKAWTPLLSEPLEGPVMLRSNPEHNLPDLVLALHGLIDFDAAGRIDSVNGGIRTTFDTVPDAPITKVELSLGGGKKSLLENSTNICIGSHTATAEYTAQNGKKYSARVPLQPKCSKKKGKKKRPSLERLIAW
jgi:hypothetical protein